MIRLRHLVHSVESMMDLAPSILHLYSERDDLDDPVPVLSEFFETLNGIMEIVQNKNEPFVICIEDFCESEQANLLDKWVATFCDRVMFGEVPPVAKETATHALASFVSKLRYNLEIDFRDNLEAVWWIVQNWNRLHSVCPEMSPHLYEFLGNGTCYRCNGCQPVLKDGTFEHKYHLYFKTDDDRSFLLDLEDKSTFECDGVNMCQGSTAVCRSEGTIMRCSDGQAIDNCCGIAICDECWASHKKNFHW